MRKDILKLFLLDMLYGSTKERTSNELVHQIIDASNHKEILLILSKKANLKANRKYAKQKLKTIGKGGISNIFFIWLIVLGIAISLITIKKNKNKRQLAVAKNHSCPAGQL